MSRTHAILILCAVALVALAYEIPVFYSQSAPPAHPRMGAAVGPAGVGPSLQSDVLQSVSVLDVEPQPLTYADAGAFLDGSLAPLAWTPAVAGRVPTKILVSGTTGTLTYQTLCADFPGVNGTTGAVDTCIPLETNVWHNMVVSRIYQQGDSGTVYPAY